MRLKTETEIMKNWEISENGPLLSICCITYNHELYIAEAIDSFLMQNTNFKFEVVIGEDCSSDKTLKILQLYKAQYPNIIKLILHENNVGIQKNFKDVLDNCKGKYIAICEGDDYWTDSDKLQIQLDALSKNKVYRMAFHTAYERHEDEERLKCELLGSNRVFSVKDIINSGFHFVQTNTLVFEKKVMTEIDMDLLDTSPVGDVWIRICASMPHGALYINRVMSAYRVQSVGSWSEKLKNGPKFINFVEKMMLIIDKFDEFWGYLYTKEFKDYKNRFLKAVISREEISIGMRQEFLKANSKLMKLEDTFRWNLLYRHPRLIMIIRYLKKMIKNGSNDR